jgi:helix-turn-helix protein
MHIDHDRAEGEGSFGAWLRFERERRQISIASIAESTKILGALFEGLENDDLTRWPDGFYRRAFVRAYARVIGLDPDWVLREFLLRFPEPAADSASPDPQRPIQTEMPRLALVDSCDWFDAAALMSRIRRQLAAMVIDGAAIAVLAGLLWIAYGLIWEPLAIVACAYFSISTLVFGATPGLRVVTLWAPKNAEKSHWQTARGFTAQLINHLNRQGPFERPEVLGGEGLLGRVYGPR